MLIKGAVQKGCESVKIYIYVWDMSGSHATFHLLNWSISRASAVSTHNGRHSKKLMH